MVANLVSGNKRNKKTEMLFEELEVDLNTMQKNDDVIAFVKSKI